MNNNTNYNLLNQKFSPKIYSKTQPFSFYNPNNQSQSFNNKISYNPNIISNQNVIPNPKNPIKWRNINKINLPHLKSSRDINVLQSYLDNLICGQISEEDIQSIPENSIVKLIQILQTTSDILLNEQAEFENEKLKLESENVKAMKEFQEKDKANIKNKEKILRLKKEKKRDVGVINTYLNVINNLEQGTYFNQENYNITEIELNQKQLNDYTNIQKEKTGEFKCEICKDKIFPTEFELTKHLEEVHNIKKNYAMYRGQNMPQNQIQILKPEITVKVPDNYYAMNNMNNNNKDNINKEEILNEMRNMKDQFYKKMEEEKLLQQELNENSKKMQQNNLNNDLNKLENTFKETIDNFKSLLLQQKNNQPNTNVLIEESEDDEDELKKIEELKILKQQLENLKQNNNKKKFEYESEEKKYESILLEFNQTKKFSEDEYANNNLNNLNNITTSFNENMQIQTTPIKLDIINENKNKINKKPYFNSGKILPDHDDTDEEYEKKKEMIDFYQKNDAEIFNTIRQRAFLTHAKPEEEKKTIKEDNKKEDNIVEIKVTQEIIRPKEDEKEKEKEIIKEPNINLIKQKKNNIELENYYKKYTKRDKKFLKNNMFNDYLIETIPSNFKDNEDLNMDELIEDKTKQTAFDIFPKNMNLNLELDEEKIKEENINNLYNLANNLINDMDEKNAQNEFINDYYKSIMKTIGIKDIQNNAQKIKEKLKPEIIIEKKEEQEKDKDKENTNTNLLNKDTVVNSLVNTNVIKEKGNNNINMAQKVEKKEETGGIILTNFIMDEANKEEKEDKLKQKPNENETNKIDNNIKEIIDMNTNKANQITNFKPNITEPKKKEEPVFVETTTIKETQQNKDNINNNQDVPHDSGMAKDKTNNINNNINKVDNNAAVPYDSGMGKDNTNNINNINKENKNADVPYDSSMAKDNNINKVIKPEDINNLKSNNINNNQNNGEVTSNTIIAQNNETNIKTDKHLDAPYTSTQSQIQPNLNNQGTQINQNVNNFQNLNNLNNNNVNHNLDMPYDSRMALVPQNQNINTINNKKNFNNNVNNYNTGYNSVVGPTYNNINSNQEKNKFPDMPYTSNMANTNNIPPPQNVQINPVNTGFSERQGIYSQEPNKEIKTEINQSSNKLKESEMVEEKKENDENNKINNKNENINNNTTVVKESVVSAGNPIDESKEFDRMMNNNNNKYII